MSVLSSEQVVRVFGDPAPYIGPDGCVAPVWETVTLAALALPAPLALNGHPGAVVTHVRCHHLIVPHVAAAFGALHGAGQWALLRDFGGCYEWRCQRLAPAVRSRHSWGIALDLNVADNPFLAPPLMPAPVVSAFKAHGFAWGGEFVHRPDGMHFEFVGLNLLGVSA